MTLVEFSCLGTRFAIPLADVRGVLHAALPVALPGAPPLVLGVIHLDGEVVPVIDFAVRIGNCPRSIHPSQQLVVLDLPGFPIAALVDEVHGIVEREVGQAIDVGQLHAPDLVRGFARLDDGVCLICAPDKFLLDEDRKLLLDCLESSDHVS